MFQSVVLKFQLFNGFDYFSNFNHNKDIYIYIFIMAIYMIIIYIYIIYNNI